MRNFWATIGDGLLWLVGFVVLIGLIRLVVDFIALCWLLWGKVI